MSIDRLITALGVALGIGMLIGIERERRKGEGPSRASAGLRTFALAAPAGAIGLIVGGAPGLCITLAAVAALAAIGYWRSGRTDPGLTTEVALVVATLLGGLSVTEPALAAGASVVVAVLLVARTPLHRFVQGGFNDAEVRDGLILASAALVILPLLPDRPLGPFQALNPHAIWLVVVLVLAIGALGHIAVRLLGERYGLAAAGLAAGFVSSTAAIAAFGARTRGSPDSLAAASAGAVLSTVATVLQLAVVIGVTSPPTLRAMAPSLVAAGLAAVAYAAAFALALAQRPAPAQSAAPMRAFSVVGALVFAATVSAVLVLAAALRSWWGEGGALAAAGLAGFADAHAAAISVAAMVARGALSPSDAAAPILLGFLANTISKGVFALSSGGRAFALRVVPGLVLVVIAAWAGLLLPMG